MGSFDQEQQLLTVHTTVANQDDAWRLARRVVTRRLAACAQLQPIDSLYLWKGELVEEPEIRISFKTTRGQQRALMEQIREAHLYEVPEISTTPLQDVEPAYRRWLIEQVQPSGAPAPAQEPKKEPEQEPKSPWQSDPIAER
ncbi:divalent-cation tolerance protein CutA [Cyanobium sp. LEGE 06143]|uniref:divalent-cation tolerance protein CutA n=1 Tax=Cyanobium sp. LEGE 06143 TaxID=945727 RepID=UPI0018818269|nr:divalent-cation tolerance protein CutA [Cyanobium sp. LEGE 06143]MBE9172575.1 divalent-cation tolerance protein CutA [Cyanobium sp. LEGE 06143]